MAQPIYSLGQHAAEFWRIYGDPGRRQGTATLAEVDVVVDRLGPEHAEDMTPDLTGFLAGLVRWHHNVLSRDREGLPYPIGQPGAGSPISFRPVDPAFFPTGAEPFLLPAGLMDLFWQALGQTDRMPRDAPTPLEVARFLQADPFRQAPEGSDERQVRRSAFFWLDNYLQIQMGDGHPLDPGILEYVRDLNLVAVHRLREAPGLAAPITPDTEVFTLSGAAVLGHVRVNAIVDGRRTTGTHWLLDFSGLLTVVSFLPDGLSFTVLRDREGARRQLSRLLPAAGRQLTSMRQIEKFNEEVGRWQVKDDDRDRTGLAARVIRSVQITAHCVPGIPPQQTLRYAELHVLGDEQLLTDLGYQPQVEGTTLLQRDPLSRRRLPFGALAGATAPWQRELPDGDYTLRGGRATSLSLPDLRPGHRDERGEMTFFDLGGMIVARSQLMRHRPGMALYSPMARQPLLRLFEIFRRAHPGNPGQPIALTEGEVKALAELMQVHMLKDQQPGAVELIDESGTAEVLIHSRGNLLGRLGFDPAADPGVSVAFQPLDSAARPAAAASPGGPEPAETVTVFKNPRVLASVAIDTADQGGELRQGSAHLLECAGVWFLVHSVNGQVSSAFVSPDPRRREAVLQAFHGVRRGRITTADALADFADRINQAPFGMTAGERPLWDWLLPRMYLNLLSLPGSDIGEGLSTFEAKVLNLHEADLRALGYDPEQGRPGQVETVAYEDLPLDFPVFNGRPPLTTAAFPDGLYRITGGTRVAGVRLDVTTANARMAGNMDLYVFDRIGVLWFSDVEDEKPRSIVVDPTDLHGLRRVFEMFARAATGGADGRQVLDDVTSGYLVLSVERCCFNGESEVVRDLAGCVDLALDEAGVATLKVRQHSRLLERIGWRGREDPGLHVLFTPPFADGDPSVSAVSYTVDWFRALPDDAPGVLFINDTKFVFFDCPGDGGVFLLTLSPSGNLLCGAMPYHKTPEAVWRTRLTQNPGRSRYLREPGLKGRFLDQADGGGERIVLFCGDDEAEDTGIVALTFNPVGTEQDGTRIVQRGDEIVLIHTRSHPFQSGFVFRRPGPVDESLPDPVLQRVLAAPEVRVAPALLPLSDLIRPDGFTAAVKGRQPSVLAVTQPDGSRTKSVYLEEENVPGACILLTVVDGQSLIFMIRDQFLQDSIRGLLRSGGALPLAWLRRGEALGLVNTVPLAAVLGDAQDQPTAAVPLRVSMTDTMMETRLRLSDGEVLTQRYRPLGRESTALASATRFTAAWLHALPPDHPGVFYINQQKFYCVVETAGRSMGFFTVDPAGRMLFGWLVGTDPRHSTFCYRVLLTQMPGHSRVIGVPGGFQTFHPPAQDGSVPVTLFKQDGIDVGIQMDVFDPRGTRMGEAWVEARGDGVRITNPAHQGGEVVTDMAPCPVWQPEPPAGRSIPRAALSPAERTLLASTQRSGERPYSATLAASYFAAGQDRQADSSRIFAARQGGRVRYIVYRFQGSGCVYGWDGIRMTLAVLTQNEADWVELCLSRDVRDGDVLPFLAGLEHNPVRPIDGSTHYGALTRELGLAVISSPQCPDAVNFTIGVDPNHPMIEACFGEGAMRAAAPARTGGAGGVALGVFGEEGFAAAVAAGAPNTLVSGGVELLWQEAQPNVVTLLLSRNPVGEVMVGLIAHGVPTGPQANLNHALLLDTLRRHQRGDPNAPPVRITGRDPSWQGFAENEYVIGLSVAGRPAIPVRFYPRSGPDSFRFLGKTLVVSDGVAEMVPDDVVGSGARLTFRAAERDPGTQFSATWFGRRTLADAEVLYTVDQNMARKFLIYEGDEHLVIVTGGWNRGNMDGLSVKTLSKARDKRAIAQIKTLLIGASRRPGALTERFVSSNRQQVLYRVLYDESGYRPLSGSGTDGVTALPDGTLRIGSGEGADIACPFSPPPAEPTPARTAASPTTEKPQQQETEIKAAAAAVARPRGEKISALRRLALALPGGGRLGQTFQAAETPVPLFMTLAVTPEKAALARKLGIDSLRELLRKEAVADMTLTLAWGAPDGPRFVYDLSQRGRGGALVLTPRPGNPTGELEIVRDAAKNPFLVIPPDSGLAAWLDRGLFGPRLAVRADGPAGRVAGLRVEGEEPLLSQVRALWAGEVSAATASGFGVPYVTAHHTATLAFLAAIARLYQESLNQCRSPVWNEETAARVETVSRPAGTNGGTGRPSAVPTDPVAANHAPGSSVREGETRTVDIEIPIVVAPELTGVHQVIIAARQVAQFKQRAWETQSFTLLFLRWGGQVVTPGEGADLVLTDGEGRPVGFPLTVDGHARFPLAFNLLTRVAPANSGGKPPHGFLRVRFDLDNAGRAAVREAGVETFAALSRPLPVPMQVMTAAGPREDPLRLTLDVFENPLTGAREISGVRLRAVLPDAVLGRLGLSAEATVAVTPARSLADGEEFVVAYPELGQIRFTVTLDGRGRPRAWRQPLESLHEIAGTGGSATFEGLSDDLVLSLPVRAIPAARGRTHGTTEAWYRIGANDSGDEAANQDTLVAWFRLTGFPARLPRPGEALALLARDGRVELTRPFEPHPDGDPLICWYLTPREGKMVMAAMLDPGLIGAHSNAWLEIAGDASEFRPSARWPVPANAIYLTSPEDQEELWHLRVGEDHEHPLAGTRRRLRWINGRGDAVAADVIVSKRGNNWLQPAPDGRFLVQAEGGPWRDATDEIHRLRRRSQWRIYPLEDQGGGRIKPFELRAVAHPEDPLLMAVVNALDEDGTAANAPELLQTARAQLDNYRQALGAAPAGLPPVFRMRKQVRFEDGTPVELRFVCDQVGTAGEAVLSGIRLERRFGKFTFDPEDPLLTLSFSVFAGGQFFTHTLRLRHQRHPEAERLILLTEEPPPADRPPLRFVFDVEDGTMLNVGRATPAAIAAATEDDSPLDGKPSSGEPPPLPDLRVATPSGMMVDVDLAVPELDPSEQTVPLPDEGHVTDLASVDELRDLMTRLNARHRGLVGEAWQPSEEASFAQALVGRPCESLVFRMRRGGHLLVLPVQKLDRLGYRADREGDPETKVNGAVLLLADPERKGHYLRIATDTNPLAFLHQESAHFRLVMPEVGPPKGWRLSRITTTAYTSEKLWGLCVESGEVAADEMFRAIARRDLTDLAEIVGLNAPPSQTTRTAGDAAEGVSPWGIAAVRGTGGGYQVVGISLDEDGPEGKTASTTLREGGAERILFIRRAPHDKALWFLRDPQDRRQHVVAFNARGEGLIFPRHPQVGAFYRTHDSEYPMSGINGPYRPLAVAGQSAAALRDVAAAAETAGDGPEWAIAKREDLSEPEDPIQRFHITFAMGRWLVAREADIFKGRDPRVAVARIEVTYDRRLSGPDAITVTALPLEDIGKTRDFPWDADMRGELHETVWDEDGEIRYGPINLLFWGPPQSDSSREKVPYFWVDFATRGKFVGAKADFDAVLAHWNHDFRFRRRKLGQEQTGYLTKRMGVNFRRDDDGRYPISAAAGTSGWAAGFTRDLFATLGPDGAGALALLAQTRASEPDRAILLSAIWLLHRHHPDWRLVDDRGQVAESNVQSLAAFAAIELAGLPPEDIVYVPGERGDDIPLLRSDRVRPAPAILRVQWGAGVQGPVGADEAGEKEGPAAGKAEALAGRAATHPPATAGAVVKTDSVREVPGEHAAAGAATGPEAETEVRTAPRPDPNPLFRSADEAFLRDAFRGLPPGVQRREESGEGYYHATYVLEDGFFGGLQVSFFHDAQQGRSILVHHLDHARFSGGQGVWRAERAERLLQRLNAAAGTVQTGDVIRLSYAARAASGRAEWVGRTIQRNPGGRWTLGAEWLSPPHEVLRQAAWGRLQSETAEVGGGMATGRPPAASLAGEEATQPPGTWRVWPPVIVDAGVYRGRGAAAEDEDEDESPPRMSAIPVAVEAAAAPMPAVAPAPTDGVETPAGTAVSLANRLAAFPPRTIPERSRAQTSEPDLAWQAAVSERLRAAGVTRAALQAMASFGLTPYETRCLVDRPETPLSLRPALLAVARALRLYHTVLLQAILETAADPLLPADLGLEEGFFSKHGFFTAFPATQGEMDRMITARQALLRAARLGDVDEEALATAAEVYRGGVPADFLSRTGGDLREQKYITATQAYYLFSLGDAVSAALYLLHNFQTLRWTLHRRSLDQLFSEFTTGFDAWCRRHYGFTHSGIATVDTRHDGPLPSRRFALYRNWDALNRLVSILKVRSESEIAAPRKVKPKETVAGDEGGVYSDADDEGMDLAGLAPLRQASGRGEVGFGGLAAVVSETGLDWHGAPDGSEGVTAIDADSTLAAGGEAFVDGAVVPPVDDMLAGPALWGTMSSVVRGWQ